MKAIILGVIAFFIARWAYFKFVATDEAPKGNTSAFALTGIEVPTIDIPSTDTIPYLQYPNGSGFVSAVDVPTNFGGSAF
jgi:hypothetical protein